jgi:hypothetical protein
MKKINASISWLKPTLKKCEEEYGLKIEIIQNSHIRVIFENCAGVRWTYFTSSTPSDHRARRNQISILKNGLKEKFGICLEKSDFNLQLFRGTYITSN